MAPKRDTPSTVEMERGGGEEGDRCYHYPMCCNNIFHIYEPFSNLKFLTL